MIDSTYTPLAPPAAQQRPPKPADTAGRRYVWSDWQQKWVATVGGTGAMIGGFGGGVGPTAPAAAAPPANATGMNPVPPVPSPTAPMNQPGGYYTGLIPPEQRPPGPQPPPYQSNGLGFGGQVGPRRNTNYYGR